MYRLIYTLEELQKYLSGAIIAAFDFETSPDEKYRNEDKSAAVSAALSPKPPKPAQPRRQVVSLSE